MGPRRVEPLEPRRVGPRRVKALKGGGPKGGGPKGGGAQNCAFFSFLPPQFSFGALKCMFGVLGLSCASPSGPVWWGRRGFTRQPESPNVQHLRVPVFKNTTKIQRKGPKEREKRIKIVAGGGKKKERNFGRSGGGLSSGGLSGGGLSGGGLSSSHQHNTHTHTYTTHHNTPHHTTPHHTTPHHTTPHHTTPHHTTPHHTTPHHTTPHHTTPHHTTPHHTTPHHNTPQHTTTHHNTPQHTTTHHNTPQHTTTHHNTPQHTTTHQQKQNNKTATQQHKQHNKHNNTNNTTHHNTPQHTTTHNNTQQHCMFDFGQFRLRPISTSANFDFGQFDFGQFMDVEFWPKSNCPKSNWPKSSILWRSPHGKSWRLGSDHHTPTTSESPASQDTGGKSVLPQWCRSSIESRSCCPRCPQLNRPWSGQSGPLASVPFTAMPVSRIDSEEFRVLVVRRLPLAVAPVCAILPVWPSPRRHWPPPGSVWHSGGAREGICCGERGGTDLP